MFEKIAASGEMMVILFGSRCDKRFCVKMTGIKSAIN